MPSEARDPEKRAELMAFRQSKRYPKPSGCPSRRKTGIDSTINAFEAYKLKQS